MSKAIRQDNLYGAEDWSVVYTSFKNAEFTSYDFDTLRQSMVEYMQVNYAEEFNDYIQSSEFIALLDLVAYVGQNLAFRMDLNARENILDTAEKRESVLRIARMLSYKPKRVRPSIGFLKITSALTTESIVDSTGSDLSNMTVQWGADPSELDYERFIKIMNSAFNSNNPFGTPAQRSVNYSNANIFEIYKFNNADPIINIPTAIIADGGNFNFDLVSIDIDTDNMLTQSEPDYSSSFNILYKNDGKGVGSTQTGFFVMAKQGYMASQTFAIGEPTSNLVLDLEQTANISEEDFYIQTVDNVGNILKSWSRVGELDFTNIVVNSYGNTNKDLYEVIYSAADVTSIKFGDNVFSNAPSGNLKVWYRLAENDYVRIKAGDVTPVSFEIKYINSNGDTHILALTAELQDNMITGIPAESIDEIKNNAPEVFYSKNRMVTGDDYNGMLPTLNNDVLLMKAENRTFSGHSRYVDLSDPTGKSRPLIEFADDGYIYKEETTNIQFVADLGTRRDVDLLDLYIEEKLRTVELLNFYYSKINATGSAASNEFPSLESSSGEFNWKVSYSDYNSSNGYISGNDGKPQRVGFSTTGFLRSIRPDSLLKFNVGSTYSWVSVNDVVGDGLGVEDIDGDFSGILSNGAGSIELNRPFTNEGILTRIIPPFPKIFDDVTRSNILTRLEQKTTFALAIDITLPAWRIIDSSLDLTSKFDRASDSTSWVIAVVRDQGKSGWTIITRETNYVFGSDELIRFYNINFAPTFNINPTLASADDIDILSLVNGKMSSAQTYKISGYYTYVDGYTDPSKVKITPLDLDSNLLPDDPEHFSRIVGNDTIGLTELVEKGYTYVVPESTNPTGTVTRSVEGTDNLVFKWSHRVLDDQTLNPSLTNIIDVYVLTKTYNLEFNNWKKLNSAEVFPPLTQTSEELRNSFRNLSRYKMLTDEVVFHPVKFKPLFGLLADAEFRAEFKVIKSKSSSMTDNELKGRIIAAIDEYFAPGNFDFGESFFFTELSTYIHTKLKTDLNSIVIVPTGELGKFGNLFEITPNRNEIVTSVATVNDITIIKEITSKNLGF